MPTLKLSGNPHSSVAMFAGILPLLPVVVSSISCVTAVDVPESCIFDPKLDMDIPNTAPSNGVIYFTPMSIASALALILQIFWYTNFGLNPMENLSVSLIAYPTLNATSETENVSPLPPGLSVVVTRISSMLDAVKAIPSVPISPREIVPAKKLY